MIRDENEIPAADDADVAAAGVAAAAAELVAGSSVFHHAGPRKARF